MTARRTVIVDLKRVVAVDHFITVGTDKHGKAWMVRFRPLNSLETQCTLMRASDVADLFATGRSSTDT